MCPLWRSLDHLMMISVLWCFSGHSAHIRIFLLGLRIIELSLHMMDPAGWKSATTSNPFTQIFFFRGPFYQSLIALAPPYSSLLYNQWQSEESLERAALSGLHHYCLSCKVLPSHDGLDFRSFRFWVTAAVDLSVSGILSWCARKN